MVRIHEVRIGHENTAVRERNETETFQGLKKKR